MSKGAPRRSPREEAPFLWLSSAALGRIREGVGNKRGSSAISVYVALCDLASEHSSATFTASVAIIAHRAALCYKTAAAALDSLVLIGLVESRANAEAEKGRLPSTYTLVSTPSSRGGVRHSLPNPFPPECRKVLTLPKGRELIERKEKEAASLPSPSALGAQGDGAAASQDPNVW